jgi:uncharacterized protein
MRLSFLPTLALAFGLGCASPHAKPPQAAPPAAPATPQGAPRESLPWATFSPETFARAKAERKYVVLDGSAEWCHWCHVMEATTYHDPEVRKILDEHFIAVKVDVDSRPDVEERYGDWGWPATVFFAPDATELGKHRGYIDPERFADILREVVAGGAKGALGPAAAAAKAPKVALSEEHLAWIARATEVELDEYWDAKQGGWGRSQKTPLGGDNAWTLWKAARGDDAARARAVFALDQQGKLIDPVWGGIYQYSSARHWDEPHFEKLMTYQAPAIDNYATAYRLTREPRHLARAKAVFGYVERFLKSPEGGFYATQDADLNAHDRAKPFLSGHDYYALGEGARLARGVPRVDTHEYGRENGLAIAAYCTLYEVAKDPAVLEAAERAARRVLATHGTEQGGITHDVRGEGPAGLYLSDNAAFGLALARLHEVTRDASYLAAARRVADFALAELADEDGGGLFASTRDPDAVGVFAKRRVPFEDNVNALRLLARLARALPGDEGAKYRVAIDRVLRAVSTPEKIKAQGRMLGDYLLALEETKGVRGALKLGRAARVGAAPRRAGADSRVGRVES